MASWKESMINRLSNPKYHRFYALIGTLTPPNPKILRGGKMCTPQIPDIPK